MTETTDPQAADVVTRLRVMHKPRTERHGSSCVQCGIVWPCPTSRVLDDAAPAAAPSAPVDRAALREDVAEALMRWAEGNNDPRYAAMRRSETVRANAYGRADAVLAVLPEPVDRAAVLREAAEICDEAGAVYASKAFNDHADGAFTLMERFLRKADEAEYVATPCSVGGCEPGGEPCTTHERLLAHAEGEHAFCEPDCGTSPSRMADEAQEPTGCDHDSQVIDHEGHQYWACLKCGQNLGKVAGEAQQPETQGGDEPFGTGDCTCIPFVREGGTARYCRPGDTVDQISGWEPGLDCPHHRQPAAVSQPGKEV